MQVWMACPPNLVGADWTTQQWIAGWTAEGSQVSVLQFSEHEPGWSTTVRYGSRWHVFGFSVLTERDRIMTGPAQLGQLYLRAIEQLQRDEGSPDLMEFVANPVMAHMVLQQRLTSTGASGSASILSLRLSGDEEAGMGTFRIPDYWTRQMARFAKGAADMIVGPLPSDEPNACSLPLPPLPSVGGAEEHAMNALTVFVEREDDWGFLFTLALVIRDLRDTGLVVPLRVRTHPGLNREKWLARLSVGLRDAISEGLLEWMEEESGNGPISVALLSASTAWGREWLIRLAYEGRLVMVGPDSSGLLVDTMEPPRHPGAVAVALEHWVREVFRGTAKIESVRDRLRDLSRPADVIRQYQEAMEAGRSRVRAQFPFVSPGSQTVSTVPKTVTVVIPHYNLGPYLLEAVESVYQSSRVPDQVVVIDDGSSDLESMAAVYSIEGRYPNLIVVRQENRGIAGVRNRGIEVAQGDVVAFLDADDKWHPEYLARAMAVLSRYPNVGFVGSWVEYFGDNDGVWLGWNTELPYTLFHNTVNSSGMVARREALLASGRIAEGTDAHLSEDWAMVLSLIQAGWRGVVIPEILFQYRVREASRSHRRMGPERPFHQYAKIVDAFSDLYRAHAMDLLRLHNANPPQHLINSPLTYMSGD